MTTPVHETTRVARSFDAVEIPTPPRVVALVSLVMARLDALSGQAGDATRSGRHLPREAIAAAAHQLVSRHAGRPPSG